MLLERFVTNDNEPFIQYNVYLNMLSYTSAKIFEQIIFVYQIWEIKIQWIIYDVYII